MFLLVISFLHLGFIVKSSLSPITGQVQKEGCPPHASLHHDCPGHRPDNLGQQLEQLSQRRHPWGDMRAAWEGDVPHPEAASVDSPSSAMILLMGSSLMLLLKEKWPC